MRKFLRFFLLAGFSTIIFSSSVRADTIGQNQTFYIDKIYDSRGRTQVEASLKYISIRAYGYVDNAFWGGLNRSSQDLVLGQIEDILREFDNRIYPTETQLFGSEPTPGVDNDPRITILFAPLIESAGGYFNTADCFTRSSDNMTSNQREMFYVNASLLADESRMESFLAHEFQHLISFNQKELINRVDDDTWLNETRSEYAVSLFGYKTADGSTSLQKRAQSFLANPSDSLTEWKNSQPDYGQVALFGEYLVEHEPASVLPNALKSNLAGIPSLNYALAKSGSPDIFTDVFKNWMAANVLNNISVNQKFGYTNPALASIKISPTRTFTNLTDDSIYILSDSIKDWQQHWYEISGFPSGQKRILKIKFVSTSLASFEVPYLMFKADGSVEEKSFMLSERNDSLYLDGINSSFNKIILMPYKKDKISGFSADESAVTLTISFERADLIPATTQPDIISPSAKPADYGLHEGDFIRAEGDIDVYIINDFGYKRLILNPAICLMYGHLGARGCFSAVKTVSPAVRDAFKTSLLFTNGETKDGKIYKLEITGEDSAVLHWLNITGADFAAQGGDFSSVFQINSNEQRSYFTGSTLLKI